MGKVEKDDAITNIADFVDKYNNLEISKELSYIEDNGIFKFRTWRDADTGD